MRFLASLGMTTVFGDIMMHLERRLRRRSKCTSNLVRVIFNPKRSQESFFDKPFFFQSNKKETQSLASPSISVKNLLSLWLFSSFCFCSWFFSCFSYNFFSSFFYSRSVCCFLCCFSFCQLSFFSCFCISFCFCNGV